MYNNELDVMIRACKEATKVIMEVYSRNFDVEIKSDNSPVTEADKKADAIIRKILLENFPSYSLLTEESEDDLERMKNDYLFVVDPVDGTKDFVKKDGMFTINVALVYKNKVVAGVVYVPCSDTYYYASKGDGAFKVTKDGTVTKIHVNDKERDLTMLTSVFHVTDEEMEIYERHKDVISKIKRYGSSLKACKIAEGSAELSFRLGPQTKEWDTAASQIVVLEAGGIFAKPDLSEIKYNRIDVYNREGFVILNRKENLLK